MAFLPLSLCESPESVLSLSRKIGAIKNDIGNIAQEKKRLEVTLSKMANLVPGRLFLDNRSRLYCVLKTHAKKDKNGVLACRLRHGQGRKKAPRPRFFAPEKVSTILDKVVNIRSTDDPHGLNRLFSDVLSDELPSPLKDLPIGEEGGKKVKPFNDRIILLEQERKQLICNRCEHFPICHGKGNRAFRYALKDFAHLWDAANAVRETLWADFIRHLNFLKAEGYVKDNGALTGDGRWASQLRIDHPLMIAEGLRLGLFPGSDPCLLAALIAVFVYDREIDVEFDQSKVPKTLMNAYNELRDGLAPHTERKTIHGFSVRPIPLWAAATIYAWAKGLDWERALTIADMTEGDLAMLVSRTADNLRQMTSLDDVYPDIAMTSAQSISLILREPVVYS